MKSILAALACAFCLAACAGQAVYSVHPFYDQETQKFVCCQADVRNSKDIGLISVHITKTGDNYTFDLQEAGVGATAPITAQSKTVSSVSQAVSDTAASAAKILSH